MLFRDVILWPQPQTLLLLLLLLLLLPRSLTHVYYFYICSTDG